MLFAVTFDVVPDKAMNVDWPSVLKLEALEVPVVVVSIYLFEIIFQNKFNLFFEKHDTCVRAFI